MKFPVSVKGVIAEESGGIFLKNERDEWELPGGKLEVGESPEECLRREILEELNLQVEVRSILDSWVYEVQRNNRVLILTYGCVAPNLAEIAHSDEHSEARIFSMEELDVLHAPQGYKDSVRAWIGKSG